MEQTTLTLKLSKSRANFLKNYAKRNKKTVSDLIEQYIYQLKEISNTNIHPDIKKISGIIPDNIDVEKIHAEHILEKH